MKSLVLLALIPTLAFADDLTFVREDARTDGSVWRLTLHVHKTHVYAHRERLKAPDGRYMMSAEKMVDWELNDAKAFDATVAALAKVPAGKRADVTTKEWIKVCYEQRCAKRAAADKGGAEDLTLEKVQWELMNHTTPDSL